MSSRILKTFVLAIVIVGGIWVLSNREKIQEPSDVVALIKQNFSAAPVGYSQPAQNASGQVIQSSAPQSSAQYLPSQQSPRFVTNVIRVASFKLNPQVSSSQSDWAIGLLANICRRYDAIAFQDVGADDNYWLDMLADRMNSIGVEPSQSTPLTGGNSSDYSYISDKSGASGLASDQAKIQSAILFNRRTLELDQSQWYTVNDPDRILNRAPLVGCFRTRGPAADQAFTFSLVNIQIDGRQPEQELNYLGEIFRAIREDGRGEDDVLIVGDFHASDRGIRTMRKRAGLTWVVSNRPTNMLNTAQSDTLVFNDVATVEFTGRGGVFDFMRRYNLRLDDALLVSDHLPVWAEFSVFEGDARRVPPAQSQVMTGGVANGELSRQR